MYAVQRLFGFVMIGLAVALSQPAFAQPDSAPAAAAPAEATEEITVRGG